MMRACGVRSNYTMTNVEPRLSLFRVLKASGQTRDGCRLGPDRLEQDNVRGSIITGLT